MKYRRWLMVGLVVLMLSMAFASVASAASVGPKNGITLIYPDFPLGGPALASCEPWGEGSGAENITLQGVPDGAVVEVTTTWANPYYGSPIYLPPMSYTGTGQDLVIPIVYPESSGWPMWDQTTNERAIAVAVLVKVTTTEGTVIKLTSKQWWIRCLPPPAPAQGCTPGYWRQDHHLDSWVATGYSPTQDYNAVFGVTATFDPHTLADAVAIGGGGERALARHAVAALLDAAHPDVNYSYTVAEVIAGVQNAYATGDFEPFKDALDLANNAGCPLN